MGAIGFPFWFSELCRKDRADQSALAVRSLSCTQPIIAGVRCFLATDYEIFICSNLLTICRGMIRPGG